MDDPLKDKWLEPDGNPLNKETQDDDFFADLGEQTLTGAAQDALSGPAGLPEGAFADGGPADTPVPIGELSDDSGDGAKAPNPLGGLSFDTPPAFSPPSPPPSSSMGRIEGASNVFQGFDDPAEAFGEPGGSDDMRLEPFVDSPVTPEPAAPPPPYEPLDSDGSAELDGNADEEDFFMVGDLSIDDSAAPTFAKARRRSFDLRNPGKAASVVAIGLVVVVAAIGLPQLPPDVGSSAPSDDVVDSVEPETPPLPDYLRAEATHLAARAHDDVLDELAAIGRRLGLEAAPPRDWMEGVYFAHASRYPAVQGYWERFRSYLQVAKRETPALFREALEARVAASAIPGEDQAAVLETVMREFDARSVERDQAFSQLENLADAALGLHEFLILKEDDIEYAPFTNSGVSKDPILEAVPANEEVRVEFWDRLERVTSGLADLEALDRVTTRKLQSILVDRLQSVAPA